MEGEEKKSYALFDGYEKHSGKNYQTKREEEKRISAKNAKRKLAEFEKMIDDGEELTAEDKKRYRSLKDRYKVKKTPKDPNVIRVPFHSDEKNTIRYIRLENCFKPKWIEKYGRKRIEQTIAWYKSQLHKKPKDAIYWSPLH